MILVIIYNSNHKIIIRWQFSKLRSSACIYCIYASPNNGKLVKIARMKLHLTSADGNNLITGYDLGWVAINKQRHTQSLILLPQQIIEPWPVTDFASITADHIAQIAALKPELVLLGTGAQHRFLHPKYSTSLSALGISLECMSSAAACRTYNILMEEGRNVAVALLLT